jgi:hypothetical protein
MLTPEQIEMKVQGLISSIETRTGISLPEEDKAYIRYGYIAAVRDMKVHMQLKQHLEQIEEEKAVGEIK